MTGMEAFADRAARSSGPSGRAMRPWPAYITGFLEMLMRFATRWMAPSSCFWLRCRAARLAALGWVGSVLAVGMGVRKMPACTSFGRSTRTGPGRPLWAISKASFIRFGSSATFLTITFHFVHALVMPTTSASWKASDPMALVTTWPEKTTRGVPSDRASCIAVTTFVAPGPEVTRTTPGFPEARA